MKRASLTAAHDSMEKVYAQLAADLSFPAHFAANLDALWDVLRTDMPGPFAVIWRDHDRARAALGEDFGRIAAVFADLAAERADFSFTLA